MTDMITNLKDKFNEQLERLKKLPSSIGRGKSLIKYDFVPLDENDTNFTKYAIITDKEWTETFPGVQARQISFDERGFDGLIMKTIVEKGSIIPPHYHKEVKETNFCISGSIKEVYTDRIYTDGDKFVIEKGQIHALEALTPVLMIVCYAPALQVL